MMKVMTMMITISYLREDLVGWCLMMNIVMKIMGMIMMKTMMTTISYLREDLVGWCLLPSCLATRDWQ